MTMHYLRMIIDFLTCFSLIVIFFIWGLNSDMETTKEKKIGTLIVLGIIVGLRIGRRFC